MPRTPKASSTNGTLNVDVEELRKLIRMLREEGVTRFDQFGAVEIELSALPPSRALEDFATTGIDELADNLDSDDRFAHVGIKIRSDMGQQ